MLGSELVLNIFVKIQSHKPLVAWSVISRHETKESRIKYNHSGQSGISSKAPTASRCWIRAVGDGPITILESASLTRASLRSRKVGMIAPASHNSARCQSFVLKEHEIPVPTCTHSYSLLSDGLTIKLLQIGDIGRGKEILIWKWMNIMWREMININVVQVDLTASLTDVHSRGLNFNISLFNPIKLGLLVSGR